MTIQMPPSSSGPLQGLRVLDMTIALAGPYGTRILADLGAEVIKVDTRATRDYATRLDLTARLQAMFPNGDPGKEPWNTGGFHAQLNRNKRSVALELATPEGRDTFLRLVDTADCIVENFTPKVMPSLGLGPDELLQRNPALVYVAMPGFGRSGPYSTFPAFAPTTEAASGFLSRVGYEDGTLVPNPMSLADFVGGLNGIVGLMASLWAARRTGEGCVVDLSQVEAMSAFVGEQFTGTPVSNESELAKPHGNRAPGALYSAVLPALGFDEWIAISVPDTDAMVRLSDLVGESVDSANWCELATSEAGRDSIDAELSRFTSLQEKQSLAKALQDAGIAAGPIQLSPDLFSNPQLSELGFFLPIEGPAGLGLFEGPPWHFDGWTQRLTAPSPPIGADTEAVLSELHRTSEAQA